MSSNRRGLLVHISAWAIMMGNNDSTESQNTTPWEQRVLNKCGRKGAGRTLARPRKSARWYPTPIKSQGAIWLFTHNYFNQHCNPIKSDFSSRIFTIAMYNSLQKRNCNCFLLINNTDTYLWTTEVPVEHFFFSVKALAMYILDFSIHTRIQTTCWSHQRWKTRGGFLP